MTHLRSAELGARSRAFGVVLVLFLSVAAVPGQQSFSTTYDDTRRVTLEGVVTNVAWVNPRAFVYVNVRDAAGTTTNWAVDVGNPLELERAGWTRTSVRAGDVVTVDGIPSLSSGLRALARTVVLKRTGAKVFAAAAARRPGQSKAPAPRWPDGHLRLGAAPGAKGYWRSASAH